MELMFLGGSREVGRLGIILESQQERILLDYGIEVQNLLTPLKPMFPLKGVFCSHCHLDHSGCIPSLYRMGYKGKVYATRLTHDLNSLLLRDSLKVQRLKNIEPPLYFPEDIIEMERRRGFLEIGQEINVHRFKVKFYSAGHIPGSVYMVVSAEGKRILFTGDIKFVDTQLMHGAEADFKDINVIISEATYSYKDHPERKELEKRLKEIVEETYHNNGITLLPTFAVSRTQELLLILYKMGIPIYLDGMGIEATIRILNHPEYIKNSQKLREAFREAKKIRKRIERFQILTKPGIVITTAGMLNGGPIGFYMKKLYKKENASLVLTGYQVEGTVGRTLLDTGRYVSEGLDVKPKMRMEFLDFSAHTDRSHLINFYKKINPEKIILMHGEHNLEFAKELAEMGFDAYSPDTGEKVKI